MEKEEIKNAKNFDELLDIKYGKIGTKERDVFEEKAQYFVISERQLWHYAAGVHKPRKQQIARRRVKTSF